MSLSKRYPRRWLGGKIFLSSYIVMTIISLVVGSFLLAYFVECEKFRKNIDFENPVKAEITEVVLNVVDGKTGSFHYVLYYKFVDSDGILYSDRWNWYTSKSEAELHLGEEIDIFIDGNGGSTPWLSYKNQKIWALVLSVILLFAGVLIFTILIIPHSWKPPKPPKQKDIPFIGVGPL